MKSSNITETSKILLLVFISLIATGTYAQMRQLTGEQIKGKGMQQASTPLKLVKWVNDNLVIFEKYDESGNKYIAVETAKGTRKELTANEYAAYADVKPDMPVIVEGDIAIGLKKITATEAKEYNPVLSPDGKYLAFTRDNDLYTLRLSDKREFRHTTDGNDVILNGYASWVYMEEILGRNTGYKAFWWSPDSKSLAFFRSDDTEVPLFTITDSPGRHGYVETMRYSKPGDKNPKVKIGMVGVEEGAPVWADFDENEDRYFGEPFWAPDAKSLWVQWMNRDQNNLKIYKVNPANGSKTELYDEKQEAWISLDEPNRVRFLSDGRAIITSDKSGYEHLYLHDTEGKLINPITAGDFTVLNVTAIDEKTKTVYFTCYKDNIGCTDFYKVGFDGKNLQRLSFGNYTHYISLSPGNKYFVTVYSNCSTPYKVALYNTKGKQVAELDDSHNPAADEYEWPKTEIVTVKSRDGQFDLPMRITWPVGFDKSKKYPVLIDVYGGPSAVQVREGWVNSPQNRMYAVDGLIQVGMDHRGSLHFGKRGQNQMYRNLGKIEMEDYSRCVEWLIANAGADSAKICINGFSYGGYVTCYALTYGANVFTHGIAGGSVTDWLLYDAPYTERFMDTPEDNPEGYKQSSVLTHADGLKGRLLLTHGLLDENVHVQNTYQLVSKLEDLNKSFELMIYPSARHGYRGAKRDHFRDLQTRFIYQYLLEKQVPEL